MEFDSDGIGATFECMCAVPDTFYDSEGCSSPSGLCCRHCGSNSKWRSGVEFARASEVKDAICDVSSEDTVLILAIAVGTLGVLLTLSIV